MVIWAVGFGGVVGALLRYFVAIGFHGWWTSAFPLATLFTNWLGSFVLAWFTTWMSQKPTFPAWLRVGFGTGVVGSFTTFSTFSVEMVELMQRQLWLYAVGYFVLSAFGGLVMVLLGIKYEEWRIQQKLKGAGRHGH